MRFATCYSYYLPIDISTQLALRSKELLPTIPKSPLVYFRRPPVDDSIWPILPNSEWVEVESVFRNGIDTSFN